jgi:deazaflavin-dependent oxidoreductase (nitroreductase family)
VTLPVFATLVVLALLGVPGASGEQPMPPADLTARLATAADRSTCRITTRGRKTGRPHTVTIWFLVDGPTLYLGTLNAKRDWVRNLEKNPEVALDFGGLRVRGSAATVRDTALDAHVRELLARKYWMAWIGSWFGKGPERTFRVDGLTLEDA